MENILQKMTSHLIIRRISTVDLLYLLIKNPLNKVCFFVILFSILCCIIDSKYKGFQKKKYLHSFFHCLKHGQGAQINAFREQFRLMGYILS